MNEYVVYRHNCPNGWCYVGITCQPVNMRWNGGLGYMDCNWEFFRYILAVGWNNIEHEILRSGLSETEARLIEREEIRKAGNRVFNKQWGPKCEMFVPKGSTATFESLSETEKAVIDLWSDSIFGVVDDETRRIVMEHYEGGYHRTLREFDTGDPIRINNELEYIKRLKKVAR